MGKRKQSAPRKSSQPSTFSDSESECPSIPTGKKQKKNFKAHHVTCWKTVVSPDLHRSLDVTVADICLVDFSSQVDAACTAAQVRLRYVNGPGKSFGSVSAVQELTLEVVLDSSGDVLSASLDEGDESVRSSLVFLVKKKFAGLSYGDKRIRVFFTSTLFQAGDPGHVCRVHLRNLMLWLRPDLSLSSLYGPVKTGDKSFDPSRFYDAIKRSRDEPCMDVVFEGLVPTLRTYQQQAVHWMVQRETGGDEELENRKHPLWVSVDPLEEQGSSFYYNVFDGMVSLEPRDFCTYVRGGILADEMGIGKTVEVLACILANRYQGPTALDSAVQKLQDELDARRDERIDCICGDDSDTGIMVQCDYCDAWQHASCVHYSPPRKKKKKKRRSRKHVEEDESVFSCVSCAQVIADVEVEGPSGSTLIVCPTPILKQWQEEITRHIKRDALKVLVYEGVNNGCFTLGDDKSNLRKVGAHDFAAADIVITTYDVLRADLYHDDDEAHQRSMRFEKKYQVIATPLTKMCWWRVCLDEAQMVECNTAQATEMAMRLYAQNRWCVTGTPMQRGLDDLHGLLRFLKAEPFDSHSWWTQAMKQPYEDGRDETIRFTHAFFRKFMWRSMKHEVLDQLAIPPQNEQVTWLKFSGIESHFYRQQHQQCAKKAQDAIAKFSLADRALNHIQASKLMKPLLSLRQACCHPQVGSSGIRSLNEPPMTLDEILEVLIEKAKVEGEEAQRQLFNALNGLAALAIMEDNIPFAVSIYREVLATSEENASNFRTDSSQKLHTSYFLAESLENGKHLSIPRTLRDTLLPAQCEELRSKHMSEYYSRLAIEQHQFYSTNKKIVDAQSELRPDWWLDALSLVQRSKFREFNIRDFIGKLTEALTKDDGAIRNASSLTLRFQEVNGLKLLLQRELDAINENRKVLLQRLLEIDETMKNPSSDDIKRAGQCYVCQGTSGDITCAHCSMEMLFQAYANRLLLLKSVAVEKMGIVTPEEAITTQKRILERKKGHAAGNKNARIRGSSTASTVKVLSRASEVEQALSMLLAYVKENYNEDGIAVATEHLEYLEALRNEYTAARSLARAQHAVLHAHDELNMSMTRLYRRISEEDSSPLAIGDAEIPQKNAEFTAAKFIAVDAVNNAKGQLRYLKGLAQSRSKNSITGAENKLFEEVCPICHEKLESEIMVMPCGHMLCSGCMALVVQRSNSKRIACPTCRLRAFTSDVARVNSKASTPSSLIELDKEDTPDDSEESSIIVKGSYGTKIDSVVRRILKIQAGDPFAKVLVFSTWKDVLDVLEHSLTANDITLARSSGRRDWNSTIVRFKQENVQVLLLPIQHGANGLNLVEAQHVVLVEPLLNPAAEAQAINRVHRIGQTCKTVVHKFIIRGTVEENIYKFNQQQMSTRGYLLMKQKEQTLTAQDMNHLLGCDEAEREIEASPSSSSSSLRQMPAAMAAAAAAEARLIQSCE